MASWHSDDDEDVRDLRDRIEQADSRDSLDIGQVAEANRRAYVALLERQLREAEARA